MLFITFFVKDSVTLSIFALLLKRKLLRKYRSNYTAKQRVLLVIEVSSPMTGFLLKPKIHEFAETQVRILIPRVRLGTSWVLLPAGVFLG